MALRASASCLFVGRKEEVVRAFAKGEVGAGDGDGNNGEAVTYCLEAS